MLGLQVNKSTTEKICVLFSRQSENMNKQNNYFAYLKNVALPVLAFSGFAGIIAGVVISLYNLCANFLTEKSQEYYSLAAKNPVWIPLLILILAVIMLIMYFLLRKTPEVMGGGVPRTEGVIRGLLTFRWLRVLINTIILSFMSFFAGFPLGAEGPSIQIGATTAQGSAELLKCQLSWRRYVITGGASAGLAVAFNAPLTGIIFALEEAHKRFTPMILLSAASAVLFGNITSNVLSKLWGGGGLLFQMGQIDAIPLGNSWMLLLIGIACGLTAVLFNFGIIKLKTVFDKKKFPLLARLGCAFALTCITGLLLVDALGGGHGLILKIAKIDFSWQMLLLLLIVKMILITVCTDSGATGGIFIPMLAVGALVGGLCGHIFMAWGLEERFYKTVVVIAMTSFFGASVRAPITAMVLIVEITGYLSGFLWTGIAIFTAFMVAELCSSKPLYDNLLELTLHAENKGKVKEIIAFSVEIEPKAFAVDKCVRDILWPANCLVLRLKRGDEEIVPDGETQLKAFDELLLRAETYNQEETKNAVSDIVKYTEFIKIKKLCRKKVNGTEPIENQADKNSEEN